MRKVVVQCQVLVRSASVPACGALAVEVLYNCVMCHPMQFWPKWQISLVRSISVGAPAALVLQGAWFGVLILTVAVNRIAPLIKVL